MNEFRAKIPGSLIFGFRKLRTVSISELRNQVFSESPEDFDVSSNFYFSKLINVLADNSFDLNLYEKTRMEAEKLLEMNAVASQENPEALLSSLPYSSEYDTYIVIPTDDIVNDYHQILISSERKFGSKETVPLSALDFFVQLGGISIQTRRSKAA